jgi:ABC-type amino acid transport system permease subunit
MRLKLVLIASLVAAVVGSGTAIAITLWRFASLNPVYTPDFLVFITLVLPVAVIILASVFVYRHTARRRKTQALLTGILAAFLSLGLFILTSILTSRPPSTEPPLTVPRNTG